MDLSDFVTSNKLVEIMKLSALHSLRSFKVINYTFNEA